MSEPLPPSESGAGQPGLPPPPEHTTAPVVTSYAGFWQRVLARLIDLLIVLVWFLPSLFSIYANVGPEGLTVTQQERIRAIWLIMFMIGAIYEIPLIAVRGQTLGKMAVGIRVVRADGGDIPGWKRSAVRWVVPSLVDRIPIAGSVLVWLIFLWMLWDPRKQGLHDKAAQTIVIRTR